MDNQNDDKKYDLYTEHIVPKKNKKIKKIMKRLVTVIASAVFFGIVAGLIMLIVYRVGDKHYKPQPEVQKESVTLPQKTTEVESTTSEDKTNAPTESISIDYETELETESELETETETIPEKVQEIRDFHDELKYIVKEASKASVTVKVTNSDTHDVYSSYGVILTSDSNYYYIVTDYNSLYESEDISVIYCDKQSINADFLEADAETNLSVLKAKKVDSAQVTTAKLGDSNRIVQGDAIIAYGDIYGVKNGLGYGVVTDCGKTVSMADAEYSTIGTNIGSGDSDFGILCNIEGEVVGIITGTGNVGSKSFVRAFAFSDIERVVVNLANKKQKVYMGIHGQSTNEQIQQDFGIPEGVYILAVDVNSPAYNAGIQTSDIITAFSGKTVTKMSDYMDSISNYSSGNTVQITVKRKSKNDYKEIVFSVTLGVQ